MAAAMPTGETEPDRLVTDDGMADLPRSRRSRPVEP